MDFAALPPEINSGRMYAGPGSGPLTAAAVAWEKLAAELYSASASYSAVISGLTAGGWHGASSLSMAAAATTYVTWLSGTAAQAEQAASQAQAAASAFEAAFAATVPPAVIAANRMQLAVLVATNFLGINTAAIMATEAHYAEMWAQDAAAMYVYAGSSAAAATLTPFNPPQRNTNPAGLGAQSAAVSSSTGSSTESSIDTIIQQILTNINKALEPDVVNSGVSAFATIPSIIFAAAAAFSHSAATTADSTATALADVGAALGRVASTLGSVGPAMSSVPLGGAVSVGMGRAATVGALSVPQSWGAAAPAVADSATALPVTLVSETQDLAGMPGPVGLTAPGGTVAAGAAPRIRPAAADGTTLRSLLRPNMLPRFSYIG